MNEQTERLHYDVKLSDELLDKITKLFALTSSPNENEASLASEMAMKLLAKYNLSMSDFNSQCQRKSENISDEDIIDQHFQDWRSKLLFIVAKNCFCMSFREKKPVPTQSSIPGYATTKDRWVMTLVGSAINRQVAIHLFGYLSEVLPQIMEFEFRKSAPNVGPGTAEIWKSGFRNGFITRIKERLTEQRNQIIADQNSEYGILRANPYETAQNEIAVYNVAQGREFGSVSKLLPSNKTANALGYDAGGNVSLNPARQLGEG